MNLERCYRILGLPPGASREDVKRAYRDLMQVWHPDRFGHDSRLREKAEQNVQRINEAYEKLAAEEPRMRPRRPSRLSETFQAILDVGDMVRNSVAGVKLNREMRVVGVDPQPSRPNRTKIVVWAVVMAVVIGMAAIAVVVWR